MPSSTKRYTDSQWLSRRASIRTMYLTENMTLDHMRERLGQEGFPVTKNQLENKLKTWGFKKKIPKGIGSPGWQYIDHHITKRRNQGKETQVIHGGQMLDSQKISRETRRHFVNRYGRALSPELPQGLRVTFRTPSPSPSRFSAFECFENIPWTQFNSYQIINLTLRISGRNSSADVINLNRYASAKTTLSLMGLYNKSSLPLENSNFARMLQSTLPERYHGEIDHLAGIMLKGPTNQAVQQHLMIILFHLSNKEIVDKSQWSLILQLMEWSGIMVTPLSMNDSQFTLRAVREALFNLAFVMLVTNAKPGVNSSHFGFIESGVPRISRMIKWLLQASQSANQVIHDYRRNTPLQIASENLLYEIQFALLKYGADPNLVYNEGRSPLILATEAATTIEELASAKLLIDYGANVSYKINPGDDTIFEETLFTIAAGHKHVDVAMHLMRHVIENANYETKVRFITPDVAISAAQAGNVDVLQLIHEHNFDITRANKFGITALHAAAREGHVECCKLLVSVGSQVNTSHPNYPSPLHLACMTARTEVVKFLYEAGASVNGRFQVPKSSRKLFNRLFYLPRWENSVLLDPKFHQTPMVAALCSTWNTDGSTVSYLQECGATFPSCAAALAVEGDDFSGAPNPKLLSCILKAGVDPNIRHPISGQMPLSFVLRWPTWTFNRQSFNKENIESCIQTAFILLDAGADVSSGDAVTAMELGNWCLVEKILLKDPQDISTMLHQNQRSFIKFRPRNDIPNSCPENGHVRRGGYKLTLLEQAIRTGNSTFIHNVLAHHPNSYSPGALCAATLNAVLVGGDPTLVLRLLRNRQTTHKQPDALEIETTAIGIAACFDHITILEWLLSQIPIYDSACLPAASALHSRWSIQNEYLTNIWFWHTTDLRCSVVNFALQSHISILQKLLDRGYRFDCLSSEIIDNLDYSSPNLKSIQNQWISFGQNTSSIGRLNRLIRNGNSKRLKWLLATCEGLIQEKKVTGYQISPLSTAIKTGQLDMVEILIEAGFDPCAPAGKNKGVTALQTAAFSNRLGIANRLVRANVDINAPGASYRGRTALEAAAEYSHIDMVSFLLESGAEIGGSGQKQYLRSIGFAEREGHQVVADMLRAYRPWSEEDGNMMKEDGLLLETPGPIDTDSDYSTHSDWSTEYCVSSSDETINIHGESRVPDNHEDYERDDSVNKPNAPGFRGISRDKATPFLSQDCLPSETSASRNSRDSDTSSWYTTEDEDCSSLMDTEDERSQAEIPHDSINNQIYLESRSKDSEIGQVFCFNEDDDAHMAGYEADCEAGLGENPTLFDPDEDIDMVDVSDPWPFTVTNLLNLNMDNEMALQPPSTGLFDFDELLPSMF